MTDVEIPSPASAFVAPPKRDGKMFVTPATAQAWLDRYNTHNREIKTKRVAAYERDMNEGRWIYDGAPIRWGTGDVMLDGQNRLKAVVESGKGQYFNMVVGLPLEAQKVMDQGAPRSVADNLGMDGFRNRMVLAAAARVGVMMDGDPTGKRINNANYKPTNAQVLEWLENHPDIIDFVNYVSSTKDRFRPFPQGVISWAMWRLTQIDAAEANLFFTDWREKRTQGRGDPLLAMLDRVESHRAKKERRMTHAEFLHLIFRTWNARHKNETLTKLQRSTIVPIPVVPRVSSASTSEVW